MTHISPRFTGFVCTVLVAFTAACSRDPETTARAHAGKADAYFASRQFSEATIEYRNALKAKPAWAEAHFKLGNAYMESGDPLKAYGAYSRAADLEPSNVDAQIQAGTLLLAGGEFERARMRAELALKGDPKNTAAHILMGNALAGLMDTRRALQQIEQAIAIDPSYAPAWTALGAVRFADGGRDAAGDAFRKAVSIAPQALEPRLALASYQWATGDTAAAENTLKSALSLNAKSGAAHRSLALLYLTTNRAPQAEPHFRALADADPGARLNLADYYAGLGRRDDSIKLLREIEEDRDKSDARAARLRIASLEHAAGRKAEAHKILDALVAEKPGNVDIRIAKARALLADNRVEEALEHARAAVKADSGSAAAHYTLGIAEIAAGDESAAEGAFTHVLSINPRAGAARLQLAQLQLAQGDAARAYVTADEAARQQPHDPAAAILKVRSLRAQGDLARAHREVTSLLKRHAKVPQLHSELGWIVLGRRDVAAAASAFEDALRLAPHLHDARLGIVSVHLTRNDHAGARARLDRWLAGAPSDARLRTLSARTNLAAGRAAEAEKELRDLATTDPSQLEAYDLLGRLYVAQRRLDRAIEEYEALAERSKRPAAARTMIGLIHEARADRASARAAYEQALEADATAGVAANNLAWMLAEDGRLDDALRLATVGRQQLRQRPEAEDTLGWVYYKKNLPGHAIAAFERAVDRAPDNAAYHYHLGLAHLKAGNEKQGRRALQRALAVQPDFPGAADARAKLAAVPAANNASAQR